MCNKNIILLINMKQDARKTPSNFPPHELGEKLSKNSNSNQQQKELFKVYLKVEKLYCINFYEEKP